MLVAVYGTLKKGEENHARFLPGKEPRFRGFVEIPYRLYENGEYPMLVPAGEKHPILIEIFEVDDEELRRLDRLESPYGYSRETIQVDGSDARVDIYVHDAPAPDEFRVLPSGEWTS